MPITRPPLPYPSEEVKTRLATDPTLVWLREIAQARRIGLGAVIRDIIERERARDQRRPTHKRLAPDADTQPPASSSTPDAVSSAGLAPVSQQGGDTNAAPDAAPAEQEVPAAENGGHTG